jgi:hypothetical protein
VGRWRRRSPIFVTRLGRRLNTMSHDEDDRRRRIEDEVRSARLANRPASPEDTPRSGSRSPEPPSPAGPHVGPHTQTSGSELERHLSSPTPLQPPRTLEVVLVTLGWFATYFGCAIGGLTFLSGVASAQGAPQQAAAAAMGVGWAILPYCFTRGLSEMCALWRAYRPVVPVFPSPPEDKSGWARR